MLEGLDKKLNKIITDITILRKEIEEKTPKKKEDQGSSPDTIFWSGFHWLKYDDE
jgi:division protein CdvB (Snf7/Vps24/ESCRT-III family)